MSQRRVHARSIIRATEMKRSSLPRAVASTALLALALLVAPVQGAEISDDEFIEQLGDAATDKPVDRKRLARMLFSLAATLDGGKSSVRLLQSGVVVPEASRHALPKTRRPKTRSRISAILSIDN